MKKSTKYQDLCRKYLAITDLYNKYDNFPQYLDARRDEKKARKKEKPPKCIEIGHFECAHLHNGKCLSTPKHECKPKKYPSASEAFANLREQFGEQFKDVQPDPRDPTKDHPWSEPVPCD